ncbi:MAG: T9SS type A sorting domain-containing protein, partial [Cytophagaceae bacterium]
PANNSTTNGAPTFAGTAPAGSTVTVYLVSGGTTTTLGTTTAPGGSFSLVPASALASGSYSVYATALASGQLVSVASNTNTFTVDATPPTVTVTSVMVANGGSTSTSPVSILLTFSEDVRPTGAFGAYNLAAGVTNAVVTGIRIISSRVYELIVSPRSSGLVTVSLGANAALDVVGNGNLATPVLYSFTALPAPVAGDISVLYQTGDLGQPTDNQLRPFLQLVNSGPTAVPYSSLTVRYWLTAENFMGQLVTPIDYAKLGTSFVSARYVALATPRQGAFGYIEYAFAAGAGNLAPGTDSGPIYGKAYKPDYSNFDETDDWSYQTSSSFTTNDHVTVYQNGTLVNGTEPPAVASSTTIRVLAGNQDVSTSTSYLNVTLQVGNAGNRPVNYSDVTVRYYFTRDGAATIVPQVDYAKLGASNISVRYVALPTPLNGADGYLEIGFSAALGVFYPRTNTDNIQFKIRKGDYSAFTQTNDYSFSPSSAVAEQPRVPAYLNGALIFGTEPTGASASAARSSQETAAKASADGATIVAAASGASELALTGSPNPFGEQLRLRFALPTTQAYTLAVYDGQGRLVQQLARGQAEAGQTRELAVPTQGYAAGLYLVRLTTASGVQHLKLIKQ